MMTINTQCCLERQEMCPNIAHTIYRLVLHTVTARRRLHQEAAGGARGPRLGCQGWRRKGGDLAVAPPPPHLVVCASVMATI